MDIYKTALDAATFISAVGTLGGVGGLVIKAVTIRRVNKQSSNGVHSASKLESAPAPMSTVSRQELATTPAPDANVHVRAKFFNYPRLALFSIVGYLLFYGPGFMIDAVIHNVTSARDITIGTGILVFIGAIIIFVGIAIIAACLAFSLYKFADNHGWMNPSFINPNVGAGLTGNLKRIVGVLLDFARFLIKIVYIYLLLCFASILFVLIPIPIPLFFSMFGSKK